MTSAGNPDSSLRSASDVNQATPPNYAGQIPNAVRDNICC
jgi:hypothetical protein